MTSTADTQRRVRSFISRSAPFMAIGVLFVALAAWSWRKWADLLVDFGNELYVPWRMTEGERLYRDLEFSMGPVSQAFNAFWFQLCGVSLSTLIWVNLAILAAIAGMIYALFLRMSGRRFDATFITLLFLAVFGFSQYTGVANYNYVCPYRHEMTHGLALILVELLCLARCAERGRAGPLFVAGAMVGLTFLMKAELCVAGAAVAVVALLCLLSRAEAFASRRMKVRGIALFAAGAAAPIVICVAALAVREPLREAVEQTFAAWRFVFDRRLTTEYPLYRALMGTDQPVLNLLRLGESFAIVAAGVVTAAVLDIALPAVRRRRRAISAAVGFATYVTAVNVVRPEYWLHVAVVLPATSALALAAFAVRAWKRESSPEEHAREVVFICWSVLSLALLGKMLLNAQVGHYGFVLAMPGALLLIHVLTGAIPDMLERRRSKGLVLRGIMLAFAVTWGFTQWQLSYLIYRGKTLAVGSEGDLTYHDPRSSDRNAVMPAVIEELRRGIRPDATLLVLPYGINVNYLLRLRNPTRHFLLTPWEMTAAGGERGVLEDFQARPADYVLLINSEMQGHGFRFFGEPGYGGEIIAWVRTDYEAVYERHRSDEHGAMRFQAVLYKRRGAEGK